MNCSLPRHPAIALLPLLLLSACGGDATKDKPAGPEAPVAKVVPHAMTEHGQVRNDDYYWMRLSDAQKEAETPDAQTRDVLDHLKAENDYRKAMLAHTDTLQKELFDEMVGRIKQDDSSVPYKYHGYLYYSRFETGQDYELQCRKKGDANGKEEIMLNVPELAKGHAYYQIGGTEVSPDNKLLAYAVDTVSRRIYSVHFKDLTTGEMLADKLEDVDGGVTWANDNRTVFYTVQEPTTLRSYRIYKHVLGTPQSADALVYEETDEMFNVFVGKTKSEQYIVIGSNETLTSEYRVLDANTPNGSFRIVQPRIVGLEYDLDHFGDHFYIHTNLDAPNFRLMRTPVNATTKENWTEVIPHRTDVFLGGIEIFRDFLVLSERKNGLLQIRMKRWDDKADEYMTFQDPAYAAYIGYNPEFNTDLLRYYYTSMTTPGTQYDYNMVTKERTLLKQQEVLGGRFKVENYTSERLWATATDGTKVPISIVYRNGLKKDGKNPLLLYGYGSYGNSMDASFSSARLSLLDRGFVFALAHIRGGQEMGRHWYEDGKLLKKKNTFTDFIDCGKFLVQEGFTTPEHLYCQGGSAGGLLVGAVVNMAPELFHGAVADVPFVDVVSTMWDESIPLTTGEFNEWGNPKDTTYYEYIRSYSPYDNVVAQDYPHMLVITGFWDSQVQYWEPAKWVAKLRATKTGDEKLLMYCNMDVGHGGASGRFEQFKETALVYAFLLDLEGITK
ncbi:MAG: S9 family peptidase [Flavobacteriales bacterium]|nr:S9 family peptidase [Flavobacteriales bacterium]